jgi:acid phosphatase type 7
MYHRIRAAIVILLLNAPLAIAHPGHGQVPDGIVLAYEFHPEHADGTILNSLAGPAGTLLGSPQFSPDAHGYAMRFNGGNTWLQVASTLDKVANLPKREMTLSAWVRVDETTDWGGLISAVSDDGDREYGWVLGYDRDSFTLGISTEGADDGDGRITYLDGRTAIELGRWYHVAGIYDGSRTSLYVNGKLDAQSTEQSGDILYDPRVPLVIGAYKDLNETHPLNGRIRQAVVAAVAAGEADVQSEFERIRVLTELPAFSERTFSWTVEPFLCFATQDSVRIVCEIPVEAGVAVRFRTAAGEFKEIRHAPSSGIHTFLIDGLQPGEVYYYQVTADDSKGGTLETELMSFQTAVERGKAFNFIMIGDTQAQPEVVKRIADIAWSHRPNFVSIAGDLVTTGADKSHWTGHFFPNVRPLISRVPLFPALGNHEGNAQHYYDYMDLPDPEYFYKFSYGDADFFVLDSQKPMGPGSEQYVWLENELKACQARWKFVIHHKPAYSSDENDYGNSWSGPTQLGDVKVRSIVPLYERYGVDIVFNGHIHVYERTFPVREGRTVNENGVIYLTIGGGGGGLENFTPFNPWFSDKKVRTHHLCFVSVNGNHLRVQAIDDQGRLFDQFEIQKDE